jgi:hypothetical protein
VGDVVVNFGVTAKVVALFASADGTPCDMDGWPVLKALGKSGRVVGGKWAADPTKCSPASKVAAKTCVACGCAPALVNRTVCTECWAESGGTAGIYAKG